jgi:hypothetical protein
MTFSVGVAITEPVNPATAHGSVNGGGLRQVLAVFVRSET